MTEATELPQAARGYLEQLRLESGVLPEASRVQLLGQIREHLGEAVDEGTDIETVLQRIGSPRELVTAAAPEPLAPAAPWRPGPLLWLAILGFGVGVLLLLWGGALFAISGNARPFAIAIPGVILAIAGAVVLVRQLRASGADPAEVLAKHRFMRGLAIVCIALGVLGLLLAGAWFMMTGKGRSVLIAIPGIVLAVVGIVTLLRGATLSRRTGMPSR